MQMLADLRPNEERAKMFVLTVPKSTGVQAGPLMSEHQVRKLRPLPAPVSCSLGFICRALGMLRPVSGAAGEHGCGRAGQQGHVAR